MNEFLVIPIGTVFIFIVVLMHHETLIFVTQWLLPQFSMPRRWHVAATVIILISAHVAEIIVYGAGLFLVGEIWQFGTLSGDGIPTFQTYLYFSFASYTSLGIGDIFPIGHIRLLTGIEALLGLLMIGWTASFLFLEMRSFWSVEREQ
ncbi:MAG: hypothetical protein ACI9UN_001704 [Granulosicoccus sp.]|jgi:hypothetical protein